MVTLVPPFIVLLFVFFFNDTATTEIYTLSLHDALPIYAFRRGMRTAEVQALTKIDPWFLERSEEHTSELQSRPHLVCRLLLEKNKRSVQAAAPASESRSASRTLASP